MNYIVFQSGTERGRISFDIDHKPMMNPEADPALVDFLSASLKSDIDAFHDFVREPIRLKIKRRVSQSDPLFPLAVKQWLERHGYEVRELHPEVDEKIAETLSKVTNEDLVHRIQDLLPSATYLEKTYLLEQLELGVSRNEDIR